MDTLEDIEWRSRFFIFDSNKRMWTPKSGPFIEDKEEIENGTM